MANTVDSIQSAAITKVDALISDVKTFVTDLKGYASESASVDGISITVPIVDGSTINAVRAAASALQPPVFTMWASQMYVPEKPDMESVDYNSVGNAPEFVAAEPIINLPTAPSAALSGAPGAAPEFTKPSTPDVPTVTLPDVPTFENVLLPTIPEVTFPEFDSLPPEDEELLEPTFSFTYAEGEYERSLLDPLRAKLLDDLISGGYGIDDADEQRLWERARDREAMATEASIQETIRRTAARGFQLPPGAMQALIESAQQSALEKMSSLSREIMIKKADLYVENRKFTIQQVKEVEDMLYKYWSFAQERVLNAAKYTAEFGKQLFNAKVARYQAKMEGYKAKAQVFDTLVKAVLANLESYKIKMEGARLSVEVQKLHADVYRTQIEGATALMGIYKVEMEAAHIQAEIEKIRLDAFRSSVEAYTAQVGAKSAEFGMYKAQIDGEMSKVEIYKAQAQAFGERIHAYTARVNAADTEAKTRIAVANQKLDRYRAEIEGYRAAVSAAEVDIKAMSEKYSNDIRKYTATVEAYAKVSDETTGVAKANADIAISQAKTLSSHILGQANALTDHSRMAAGASAAGINGLASAANALGSQVSGILATIT